MAFDKEHATTIIRRDDGSYLILIDRDGIREAHKIGAEDRLVAFAIYCAAIPFDVEASENDFIIHSDGYELTTPLDCVLSIRTSQLLFDGSWRCEIIDSEVGMHSYIASRANEPLELFEG